MSERTSARYKTVEVSEGEISGSDFVFTDRQHLGKLRLTSHQKDDETTHYALESPLTFTRLGIAEVMTEPLDIPDVNWPDVQKGLRLISYPRAIIERTSRSAENLRYLQSIQHDAGSLARSMSEHNVQSRTMPVFYEYGETRLVAARKLHELDRDVIKAIIFKALKTEIKSRLIHKSMPRDWGRRTSVEQRQELLGVLQAILMEKTKEGDAKISAQEVLDYLMSAELEDLENFSAQYLFDRFSIEKDFGWDPDDSMKSPPTEVYVQESDIPQGVNRDKTTTVVLGPKSEHNREDYRRVEFWTERPQRIVQPVLRWTRKGSGDKAVRIFRFKGVERTIRRSEVDGLPAPRNSPLMGAAIAAIHFGQDVDYDGALRRYFKTTELSKAFAGFLPLVLAHSQEGVLDNSYVRQSEWLVDNYAD